MTATDPTSSAEFEAAIRAAPDDDLPRLVYADWLDEHGEGERAEFIRVQCKLARGDASLCSFPSTSCNTNTLGQWAHASTCPVGILHRRERELLGPHTEGAYGENYYRWFVQPPELHGLRQTDLGSVVVRRGFVAEVRCRLADWIGGECDNCGGTGRVDGDRWEQSEPCPDCGGEYGSSEEDNPRGVYPGTGRSSGVGPAIVAAHPVTRVEVTDQTPDVVRIHDGSDRWVWRRWPDADTLAGRPPLPGYLPGVIWDTEFIAGDFGGGPASRAFLTREAAFAALSAALIAWVKK